MADYGDIIDKHAARVGVDPKWMRKIMRIESGGDPGNVTGSYKGLFQLSEKEFKAHGGSGNILDPEQNAMAAANMFAKQKLAFKEKYGREATLGDLYMIHQQGAGGAAMHAANPDQPAWKNMLNTAEGRQKGAKWARDAIWGNIPDKDKAKFGNVDNVTSKQFTEYWNSRMEGTSYSGYGPFKVAQKGEAPEGKGTLRGTFLGEEPEVEAGNSGARQAFDPVDIDVSNIVPSMNLGRMRVPSR